MLDAVQCWPCAAHLDIQSRLRDELISTMNAWQVDVLTVEIEHIDVTAMMYVWQLHVFNVKELCLHTWISSHLCVRWLC